MAASSIVELQLADPATAHHFISSQDPDGLLHLAIDSELSLLPGDKCSEADERIYMYGARLRSNAAYFWARRELALPGENSVVQEITMQLGTLLNQYFLCADEGETTKVVSIIPEVLARSIGNVAIARNRMN